MSGVLGFARMSAEDRIPVIVGVGEAVDRAAEGPGLEPAALMVAAARAAEADAGAALLGACDSLDIVNEVSWPYPDAVGLVSGLLGMSPRHGRYGPVGGQSPVQFIHEAALRIARGDSSLALVVGAEAESSVRRAAKAGVELPWSPRVEDYDPPRAGHAQAALARTLEVAIPTNVYPFYESATRAAWGQSFSEARAESAALWAGLSAVAATQPSAWQKRRFGADEIATVSADNRMIAWPYPKLMVANPLVNQGAAVVLTSLARARALGIAEDRIVYPWGGAAANEPADYLARERYDRAGAMAAVLDGASAVLAGEGRAAFDLVELYSCFPVVPKMARRHLGLGPDAAISVTGGLTFFGAPLNNYMAHAAVAMVRRVRAQPESAALLYGQGGYVSKHHALVVSARAPARALAEEYQHPETERPSGIPTVSGHAGPAVIEACTVLFDRAGAPRHGVVIARTPEGGRLLAKVAVGDETALALLLSESEEPVGARGLVTHDAEGIPLWTRT
ncbi:MAG: hypothetical protein JWP35_1952 [Caulobacter sp.]|nr:hypothetical protein [Caulobacter sp.]